MLAHHKLKRKTNKKLKNAVIRLTAINTVLHVYLHSVCERDLRRSDCHDIWTALQHRKLEHAFCCISAPGKSRSHTIKPTVNISAADLFCIHRRFENYAGPRDLDFSAYVGISVLCGRGNISSKFDPVLDLRGLNGTDRLTDGRMS